MSEKRSIHSFLPSALLRSSVLDNGLSNSAWRRRLKSISGFLVSNRSLDILSKEIST